MAWRQQDIMKVVPDPDADSSWLPFRIPSAYSRRARHLQTYGTIIQHIEPPHLANLPVPRLP